MDMTLALTLAAIYVAVCAWWTWFTWIIAEGGSVWVMAARSTLWFVWLPLFIIRGFRDELRAVRRLP